MLRTRTRRDAAEGRYFLAGASEADEEMLALTSPSAIAENAFHQKVFIFHGDEDPAVVAVEHSRRMWRSAGSSVGSTRA